MEEAIGTPRTSKSRDRDAPILGIPPLRDLEAMNAHRRWTDQFVRMNSRLSFPKPYTQNADTLYSKPILGENQYGPYEMWTVAVDGERQTLFARNGLGEAIKAAAPMAGETLRITKTERQEGKGFDYVVERPGQTAEQPQASAPANNGNGEADRVRAYVGRYVRICKELSRQWPDLHDKDPELFKSAAGCIYIQLSNGR